VAGLFVVVLHLYKEKAEGGELAPAPQLLTDDEVHHAGFVMNGNPVYRL
jgi:hypothetical protein